MSIDDDFVTLPPDRGADISSIRGGDYTGHECHRWMGASLLDVPCFSVIANADRISPFNRGISHFFCCSGEPYRARTSATTLTRKHEGNMKTTHPYFPCPERRSSPPREPYVHRDRAFQPLQRTIPSLTMACSTVHTSIPPSW